MRCTAFRLFGVDLSAVPGVRRVRAAWVSTPGTWVKSTPRIRHTCPWMATPAGRQLVM